MRVANVLIRIGGMLRRSGPWSRLRFIGLLSGSLALTIGLSALILTFHYTALRDERALSLQPVTVARSDQANVLYLDKGIQLDDRPVTVISLWPLHPDAPLPPGITRWPEPGQAVLSPQLRADLGPARIHMFGEPVGSIRIDGLEVPSERRVYLRPSRAALDERAMTTVSHFGVQRNGPFVGAAIAYAAPKWQPMALLVAALVVPSLMGLALSAGVDGEARARRARLLTVLGAGPRHLMLVDLSEAWPGVAYGSLGSIAGLLAICAIDVRLPWLDAQFNAADTRSAWPGLLASIATGHLLALVTVLGVRRRLSSPRRYSMSRPRPSLNQPAQHMRILMCIVAALATVWLPAYETSPTARTLSYSGGVLLFVMTFPALLGAVLAGVGAAISPPGGRQRSVGSLLGGRRLALFSGRTTRILLGICGTVLVLGQVQLWAGVLGAQYHDALGVRAEIGTAAVMASPPSDGHGVTSFLRGLSPNVATAWMWSQPIRGTNGRIRTTISGSCAALAAMGSTCQHPTLNLDFRSRTLAGVIDGVPTEIQLRHQETAPNYRDLGAKGATLWLLSRSGRDLGIDRLQQRAFAHIPGGLALSTVGQDWVTAGREVKLRGSWTVFWGSLGVIVLALATAVALAGDVLASARSTASLVAISDRRRWLFVAAWWQLSLPIALAGILAAGAYYVLPTGMRNGTTYMTPSVSYVVISAGSAVFVGIALAAWASRAIARAGGQWRPGSGRA